jgi:predicted transcriptional regulator
MTSITIETEADLLAALEQTAQHQAITVESLVKKALQQYLATSSVLPDEHVTESAELEESVAEPRKYSFIGIGRSGKKDLSTRVEEILAAEMGLRHRQGSPT